VTALAARVRELDAATAPTHELEAVHALEAACAVDDVVFTPAEAIAFMRAVPARAERRRWVAEDDGIVVGAAVLFRAPGSASAWVDVLVAHAARRRGFGRALLAGARAAAPGCVLIGEHATSAGSAFARAVGAVADARRVRSVLELPTAALPRAEPPEGYRLRSWVGAAPDDLVQSYARARNAIADAPLADGEEPETWDVARVRDLEATLARRNRQSRVTVAVEAAGDVVAFTELRVSPPPTRYAATDDTAVVAAHRRRGLGRAVKAESLARLRADRPDIGAVATTNAEDNVAMLALNAQLGFRPSSLWTVSVLRPDR
jgi:GNAT superfamily N-acetyltransferase